MTYVSHLLGRYIIYYKTVDEYINHLDYILIFLVAVEVSLRINKCQLFASTLKYLGHVIRPEEL